MRRPCGPEDVGGLVQRADEEKADHPSIRVRPDDVKLQDVGDTHGPAAAV